MSDDKTNLPQWARDWIFSEGCENDPEVRGWIRSRPESIKALLIRFPPGCLVRTKEGHSYCIPAQGCVGFVASYFESGEIKVAHHPDDPNLLAFANPIPGLCDPDKLEVVGYRGGQTPKWVLDMLGVPHA